MEYLEESIREQRRKAFRRALAWALAWTAASRILTGDLGPIGLAIGLYVSLKRSQGDAVVLWLRRFHKGDVQRTRFHRLLRASVRGSASL